MRLSSLSSQRAAIILPILLSIPLNVCATAIERRGNCCPGSCDDDDNGNQAPTLDGPTSDRAPGIGVEFETGSIKFESSGCDKPSTDSSKGKMVGNRQGDNWKLTADTTLNEAGLLDAEYILDGTQIKLETGKASQAAEEVAGDITAWNPFKGMQDPQVEIEDSTCNPWTITEPEEDGAAAGLKWAMQVTAPLPLEAISDLFSKAVTGGSSALLPSISPDRGVVSVTKEFFQANPNGISSDSVTDDVLGFFSLVLSYAKGAKEEDEDTSPKEIISIMPRTDWTNVFNQVKADVPGTLYDVVKIVACYKRSGDGVEIDGDYCGGTVQAPEPNAKMDGQTFKTSNSAGGSDSCTVQEWIQSIQDGNSPDRLSQVDQIIDGSIGGLKDALENVINTARAVPLFEFRRLPGAKSTEIKDRVTSAEQALIDYHHALGAIPRFGRTVRSPRSAVWKRQDPCADSAPSSTPVATAQLTCNGVDTTKWMGRDALNNVIGTFCADAEAQGVQDKDSGSIQRSYNAGGPDEVSLSMDWPSGADFKPQKDACVGYLSTVMDSCDGNEPDKNPLNWKHGGYNQVGDVRYNVNPTMQRYKAGTCSMHVHEEDYFSGVDGPGTSRSHTYYLRINAKDADGNTVASVDNDAEAGDGNSYHLAGYYNDMVMTPEAQGGDYIQFTIGDQSWHSDQGEGAQRCDVGGWDGDYSPVGRDMDCFFLC